MKIFRYTSKKYSQNSPAIGAILSGENFINIGEIYKSETGKDLSIIDLISTPSINIWFNDFFTSVSEINLNIKNIQNVKLLCPIDSISSVRDGYAFRQHVETSRRNRGLEMIDEFNNFPIYYYSNHNAINGPGLIEIDTFFSKKLDYELEVAIIIGKKGINISPQDADNYIYGFSIMNDLSSRQIQMEEMKLNLGPAKGKDFATSIGPYICTKDELQDSIIKTIKGNHYDIELTCKINGIQYSSDNLKNMHWTFAEIISQISKGTWIYPSDIIGSGTCATGCFYELNSSKKPSEHVWLKHEDSIDICTDKIGTLSNKIKIV